MKLFSKKSIWLIFSSSLLLIVLLVAGVWAATIKDNCQYHANGPKANQGTCTRGLNSNDKFSTSCSNDVDCGGAPAFCSLNQEDVDSDGVGDACDPVSCGNKIVETGEVCDIATYEHPTPGESGVDRQYTCSGDCQSTTGGYCGNWQIESAYGEECEGDKYEGIDSCTADCQWTCPNEYLEETLTFAFEESVNLALREEVEIQLPACREFATEGSITMDVTLNNIEPPSLDLVFISDLSSSMSSNLSDLKTGLSNALDQLNTGYNTARVALVAFNTQVQCNADEMTNSPCGDSRYLLEVGSNLLTLQNIVDSYSTTGLTYTSIAVQSALNILASSSAEDRVIVLMSDGKPSNDPQTEIDTAKNQGIIIYTIAFTEDLNLISTMNGWATDADHAYASDDLEAMYEKLTAELVFPLEDIRIYLDEIVTKIVNDQDQNDLPLILSSDFCQDPSVSVKLWSEFSGDGTITFSDAKMTYCSY